VANYLKIRSKRLKRILSYLPLTLLIVVSDQITKYWAYQRLRTGIDIEVINGFWRFTYTENRGIAFGLFNSQASPGKTVLLSAISVIAAGLVILYAVQKVGNNRLLLVALMAVLGGIIGNLIDRLYGGAVIDFIDIYYASYHWPTFNVADIGICVGTGLMALDLFRSTDQPTE
jgi:signal peptidase II